MSATTGLNLNGTWDFGFDDANQGEKEKWYEKFPGELKIEVPFTYETKLSGIQDERRHDNIWYHKTITVDASKLTDNRLLIHFEGSDFHTKLWVNGAYAGDHKGGYARFSFDITELVKDGENELTVKVEDSSTFSSPVENSAGLTRTSAVGTSDHRYLEDCLDRVCTQDPSGPCENDSESS